MTDFALSSRDSSFAFVPNPTPVPKSANCRAPILDVMIKMVFLKSIFRPNPSVMCPSSNTCKSKLNTSGCAFSISSNRIMEYGLRRTFSVNCPPSSYPTYPGGAPTNLEIENFSMYSDISMRINASSESNKYFARTFANCVFPTPVGPRKKKEPIGLFGSFNPARFR